MKVEITFAKKDRQIFLELDMKDGSIILDAIEQSKILEQINNDEYLSSSNGGAPVQLSLDNITVGIFGKIRELKDILQANDRVEIYRPLVQDPKELRKKRAKANPISKKKKR